MFKMIPYENKDIRLAKRALNSLDTQEVVSKNANPKASESSESDNVASVQVEKSSVYNPSAIPSGTMDIFWRSFNSFLPEGVEVEDLSPEELKLLRNKYRFSPLRPSTYQGITGIGRGALTSNRGSML